MAEVWTFYSRVPEPGYCGNTAQTRTPPAQSLRPGASRLQLDRLDFGDEPSGVVTQVRGDHVEHGVTEAADVQDVGALGRLTVEPYGWMSMQTSLGSPQCRDRPAASGS